MLSVQYFASWFTVHTHGLTKAIWLRHLSLLQHATQQGKWACSNMHFRHPGFAATCTSTRKMEVGREVWYTWLQLLTMATMGKNAMCHNSTSDVRPWLMFSQEFIYMPWVMVIWLDLLCASLANCNIIYFTRWTALLVDPASHEHCFLVACCLYDSRYAALSLLPKCLVYSQVLAAEMRLLHATQHVVAGTDSRPHACTSGNSQLSSIQTKINRNM